MQEQEQEYTVTCANPKCGRYFPVTMQQAILNPKLRCPHCGKSSEYDLLHDLKTYRKTEAK